MMCHVGFLLSIVFVLFSGHLRRLGVLSGRVKIGHKKTTTDAAFSPKLDKTVTVITTSNECNTVHMLKAEAQS